MTGCHVTQTRGLLIVTGPTVTITRYSILPSTDIAAIIREIMYNYKFQEKMFFNNQKI